MYLTVCFNRASRKAVLVFEGVDTVSTISLNGVVIGKTDNMFQRYVCTVIEKDIRKQLSVPLLLVYVYIKHFSF